jgi:hypothetical protein
MAEHDHTTGGKGLPAFTLIDLEQHEDGKLLRLCARMTHLQDRFDRPGAGLDSALSTAYWETADQIAHIHPATADGLQMKALVALGMISEQARTVRNMCGGRLSTWDGVDTVVQDVLRGLPA